MKVHLSTCPKKIKYHYVNLIAESLREMGHDVFCFDNEDYKSRHLFVDKIVRRSPLSFLSKKYHEKFDFNKKYKDFIGKKWLESITDFKPDLVIVINMGWLSRDSFRVAKEKLKIKNLICWIVDDPGRSEAEDLLGATPYCDHIFIIDRFWMQTVKYFNSNIHYLPLGSSLAPYKPLNIDRDLDFSFVGSFFSRDPGGFFRAFFLSHLPSNLKNEIYGPGLNYFKGIYSELKNLNCFDKSIGIEDLNKLWNRSKTTITIYNPQVIMGTSPRVFDAALTKTFQLIQETSSIYELFPGVEAPIFNSVSDFLTKLDYFLNHKKEREEIAEEMFNITKEKHLFSHRIKEMIELIN